MLMKAEELNRVLYVGLTKKDILVKDRTDLRELYEPGYYFKTTTIPYDNEPIYAVGFMLGMEHAEDCLRLIDAVDSVAMDIIRLHAT
jgi:aldehyde:ferredoxin oxidoreductase